jgi:hypothetical protein
VQGPYTARDYVAFRAKLYAWQTLVDRQLNQASRANVMELVDQATGVDSDRKLTEHIATQIVDLTEIAIAAADAK